MYETEASNLVIGTLIVSIQGEQHDAKPITHIYPNQEPGWIWVRMGGIADETHYDRTYRLTPYELVTVV